MLRILTVLSCILMPVFSFAAEQTESRDTQIIQALRDLSKQLPQQYLSLDAVADHNDYDADKIIKWVSRNIQYSPSPGYQLTPENTLLTASGNALEQALLLQNVLTLAGFEVRISKTELGEKTANELLKQSFSESPANQWTLSDEVRDQSLRQFATAYGEEEKVLLKRYQEQVELTPWNNSKLYGEAKSLSEKLYRAIEEKSAWQLSDNAIKPWTEIAQNYYFVKYRMAQGDEWLQAHPAFVENAPDIATSTYFTDDITKQHHKITLQAFITREIDGKKTENIAVTPVVERNTQQLFDGQLTFVTAPSNLQEAMDENSLGLIYESKYFIPLVDGELVKETRVFSLDGRDYAPEEVFGSMQDFVSTLKDKTGKAGSSLDNLARSETEESAVNGEGSSVLLDYFFLVSWTAPNGDSRTIKRLIYQKQDVDSAKSIVEAVSQRVLLAAEPGVLSSVAQSSLHLNNQASMLTLMQKAGQQNLSEAQIINLVYDWYRTQKDLRFNTTLALSRAGARNGAQQFYSPAPMIAMIWERQDYGSDQLQAITVFDYLINASQIADLSDGKITVDASAALAHGVWSTYAEALVQAATQSAGMPLSRATLPESVASAAMQFNQNTEGNNSFDVIASSNHLETTLPLSPHVRAMLMDVMNNNPDDVFILPRHTPVQGHFAYYRVNTQTGEALGYSELGRGAAGDDAAARFTMIKKLIGVYTAAAAGAVTCVADNRRSFGGFAGCMGCVIGVGMAAVSAIMLPGAASVLAVAAGSGTALGCKIGGAISGSG